MTIFWEQEALDNLDPEYNIALVASNPMQGRHHSEETKAKIGAANAGNDISKAVQASVKARKGKALSEEHKSKIAAALKGRDMSKQTEASLRARGIH